MRMFMYLMNMCMGMCELNMNGIICMQKYLLVMVCVDVDFMMELCDTTEIYEFLYVIGFKYYSGGYKCKQLDYDDLIMMWWFCEYKDYGGVFDVLGLGLDMYGKKMVWGVFLYLRWDMYWFFNDNVKVIMKINGCVDDDVVDVSEMCILSLLSVDMMEFLIMCVCVVCFFDDIMLDLGTIWFEF